MKLRSVLFLSVLVLVSSAMVLAESSDFRWNGNLHPGQTLTVRGINGSVEAELADGNLAEVLAIKKGRRSDPDSVEIEVVEHADGVTICAMYPSRRGNECLPFGQGRADNQNNDVEVQFIVRVPPQVEFIGKTVNGGVEAEGLDGDVEAHTVNGSIKVSTTGLAKASTVNGSIRASMGAADWEGELEYTTVNGSITLEFPEDLRTQLRAESLNGSIRSDFDITLRSKSRRSWGKQELKGYIGGDESARTLSLETVNGDVKIRRGESLR